MFMRFWQEHLQFWGHRKPRLLAERPRGRSNHERFRPSLEVLEVRYCPAAQNLWTGAQSALWNVAGNWQLGHVPTAAEQAVFSANQGFNNPVEVNVTTKIDSIVMQNGYNALMTIDDAITLETANGFNLSGGTANIDFKSLNSTLQADAGNSQLGNFEFTDQNGTVLLDGGTLTVGNSVASP
jgi:hypothetical protein